MLKKYCGLIVGLTSITIFTSCTLLATIADDNKHKVAVESIPAVQPTPAVQPMPAVQPIQSAQSTPSPKSVPTTTAKPKTTKTRAS